MNANVQMEEVCAERLIARTWDEFNRRTLSHAALFILWGGFESADELVSRYFEAKGQKELLDKRRRLSDDEEERVEGVRCLAQQAVEYRDWARQTAGDPLLRDVLVAYCGAFENALKSVALAFRIANEFGGSTAPQLMPTARLTPLRREVRRRWEVEAKVRAAGISCTAERFFVNDVMEANPDRGRWPFPAPTDEGAPCLTKHKVASKDYWPEVAQAFKLRNDILHQGDYVDETLKIAGQTLHMGSDVQLDVKVVSRVRGAFSSLLYPINPVQC